MTDIVRRVEDILGPWPSPDEVRHAMLLLAEHVQRHDELVAAQWEYDGGVDARAMPDDRMDALCQRVRALREEIAGAAEGINLADASGVGIALLTPEEFLAREGGVVPQAELDVANATIDSLQEQLDGAWADANEHAEKANKRIKELEEKLRYAEYALGVMKDADDFDADANAADQRRMKMLEGRVDAKTDEINRLVRHARELEEEVKAANAAYQAMHDAWLERNDTIATLERRNHELAAHLHTLCDETRMQSSRELDRIKALRAEVAEHRRQRDADMQREEALKSALQGVESRLRDVSEARGIAEDKCEVLEMKLAERDADAELGRAIRELKPNSRDWQIRVECEIGEETSRYRIVSDVRSPGVCVVPGVWYPTLMAAINAYKKEGD